MAAKNLHGEEAALMFARDRQDCFLENVLVVVNKIQGDHDDVHLAGVNDLGETSGAIVAGDADETGEAPGFNVASELEGAAGGEDVFRRFVADAVDVEQIDVIGFEAAEGIFKLFLHFAGALAGIVGEGQRLGGEKDFVAPTLEGFAEVRLGHVVIVGGVNVIDTRFEGSAIDGDAGRETRLAEADRGAAEAKNRDFLPGATQDAQRDARRAGAGVGIQGAEAKCRSSANGSGDVSEERSAA